MHISIQQVSRKFDKVVPLDDVSLEISPGTILCVLGLNGAGKTTLFRCLTTLVIPDSGTITFDGQRLERGRLDLRKKFLFLPDFPFMFGDMTVVQHIGMVLRLFGMPEPSPEKVVEVLKEFDLLPLVKTRLAQLSRGQLYKSALAALVLLDPELAILDEPFASGMDPNGISSFKRYARYAAARGKTVLYSTQILEVAEGLADAVCVLDRGKVLRYASIAELKAETRREHGVLEELFAGLRES